MCGHLIGNIQNKVKKIIQLKGEKGKSIVAVWNSNSSFFLPDEHIENHQG